MVSPRDIADTWSSLYSNSPALRSVVSFAHVGGLVTGGGYAIAMDLDTLRAARRGGEHTTGTLARLRAAHRIVVAGLLLVVASGFLLMLADVDAYLESTAFWIKMGLVVCLSLNGAVLVRVAARRTEDGAPSAALRLLSMASLALWLATTFVGAVVPNVL